jgi:hypothetical protein
VSLETRARDAAAGLLAATIVAPDDGLARLRRTHHRRNALRVAGAAVVVAGVVAAGALMLDGPARTAPPVKPVQPTPGTGIVHGFERGAYDGVPDVSVLSLPAAGSEPFPSWEAFDQDSDSFLYPQLRPVNVGGSHPTFEDVRTLRVLAPGLTEPVATIHCVEQCDWMYSFGPGSDEVTTLVGRGGTLPRTAQVWGYDGMLRTEIDLVTVVGPGWGIADLEWSPDGSRLAVSTFPGRWEPDCPSDEHPTRSGTPNVARVYLLDQTGRDPTLVFEQGPDPALDLRTPTLDDLAWSPDGKRLGLISSTYCEYPQPRSPRLYSLDIASDRASALYRFDDTVDDFIADSTHGFAWSPDGTRLAVTSGAGIAILSSDGQLVTPTRGSERGPLAWLDGWTGALQ